MTPPLTQVPATLPGLVRRCTPLIYLGRLPASALGPPDGLDVPIGFHFPEEPGSPLSEPAPVESLTVDLTDSTGRAHGLRAILISEGYPDSLCEECTFREIGDGWAVYHGGDWLCGWLLDYGLFDGISRDDETRLPDGSLWRRAEALAPVLLHVLGGAQ